MGIFIPMVVVFQYLGLFSGKFTYGKSPFLMGKSTLPSGKRLHHEKSNFFFQNAKLRKKLLWVMASIASILNVYQRLDV
jgi:hypothetical protein